MRDLSSGPTPPAKTISNQFKTGTTSLPDVSKLTSPYVAPVMSKVQSPGSSDLSKLSPQGQTKAFGPGIANGKSTITNTAVSNKAPGSTPIKINSSQQFNAQRDWANSTKNVQHTTPDITAKGVAGAAADILFGTGSFKSAVNNAKEVFTGKNAQGKSVNRLKSAASAIGDTTLGATNLLSTAALLAPGAGEFVKSGDVALNAAVKGAKAAQGAKVSPATSKAITTAVKAKNAAAEAAAAKSAKVVSAGDLALTSAMKGAKAVGANAAGKTASGLAAGALALGPGAAGINVAEKFGPSIVKSIDTAKASKAADTFVPSAAKATTKATSGGKVTQDVIKPVVAASEGVKAGTSGKIAQTVTAGNAVNNMFNNNTSTNTTGSKTSDATKITDNTQSTTTTNNSRVGQFKDEVKASTTTAGKTDGTNKNNSNKTSDTTTKKTNDTTEKTNTTDAPTTIPSIIPNLTPAPAPTKQSQDRGPSDEGAPPPKKEEPNKKKKPLIKLKNDGKGSRWNPSSIV